MLHSDDRGISLQFPRLKTSARAILDADGVIDRLGAGAALMAFVAAMVAGFSIAHVTLSRRLAG